MTIFFNFQTTSNHLQVKNCDSDSWLVVDEDDYDKFRLEKVKKENGRALRVKHPSEHKTLTQL